METNNIPKIKPEWLVGITMTSEQKAKWLAALRSGEYRQCTGAMSKTNCGERSFCCLGLLGEIIPDPSSTGFGDSCDWLLGDFKDSQFWDPTDEKSCYSLQRCLAFLNDRGWRFTQIADYIEANIPACDEVRS